MSGLRWSACKPYRSIGPSTSSSMSARISTTWSGRMPRMFASKAAWWILHNAMPFGTIRATEWVGVGEDVRGVEQLTVAQSAHGARGRVRGDHALTEHSLMQSDARQSARVRTAGFVDDHRTEIRTKYVRIFESDRKGQTVGIVGMNEHRPQREVAARRNAVEVDERHGLRERASKAHVVAMTRIRPPVSVPEHPVIGDLIVVRSLLPWKLGHCGYGDRDVHASGCEDALGPSTWTRRPSISKP